MNRFPIIIIEFANHRDDIHMCVILPLLNMLRNCNMFHFLQLYRSSFKLTVTRLNNNNNMYPLPFFYLNWELGR